MPPDQADDPDLEEEEGAAAEDADANNGAQGGILIRNRLSVFVLIVPAEVHCSWMKIAGQIALWLQASRFSQRILPLLLLLTKVGCVYALRLLTFVSVFAADDMNWNALEWDRAAEELTWERVTLSARRCTV